MWHRTVSAPMRTFRRVAMMLIRTGVHIGGADGAADAAIVRVVVNPTARRTVSLMVRRMTSRVARQSPPDGQVLSDDGDRLREWRTAHRTCVRENWRGRHCPIPSTPRRRRLFSDRL